MVMQKKVKMLLKNKPKFGIAAFVCTIIFVLASTLAWFSATDAKNNEFKTNFKFNVELVDEFEKPDTFEPDQLTDKKVSVLNSGDIDAFVRVMAFPVALKDKTPLQVNDGVEVIFNNLDPTNWLNGDDGYYYYLGKLKPGEEAPALFDGVTIKIKDEEKETYNGATFNVIVKSEGVDARKNEYRYSWWANRDNAPDNDPLKTIDQKLQKLVD
jgi:predicted ribosomally synthesized peptide with SipW-like signal peptide